MEERLAAYLAAKGQVDRFRSISPGWETEVYAFDLVPPGGAPVPLVLRLYQGANVAVRAENEFRMMRFLGQTGYPVPRVDGFEADPAHLGGPFLLMEQVEGRPLGRLYPERSRDELAAELCRLMVGLHRMEWQAFVGPDRVWPDLKSAHGLYSHAWIADLLRAADLLAPVQPLLDWLAERGKSVDFQLAPLHGDFHFENVLVRTDGSPAVIDWGITGIGDPRYDLAYTYILQTTEGRAALGEQIRQIYESKTGPVADFYYFEAWALIRRLIILLVVLVRGSAVIGLRPGLEAEARKGIGYIRLLAALVSDRTGLRLPAIDALLAD